MVEYRYNINSKWSGWSVKGYLLALSLEITKTPQGIQDQAHSINHGEDGKPCMPHRNTETHHRLYGGPLGVQYETRGYGDDSRGGYTMLCEAHAWLSSHWRGRLQISKVFFYYEWAMVMVRGADFGVFFKVGRLHFQPPPHEGHRCHCRGDRQ